MTNQETTTLNYNGHHYRIYFTCWKDTQDRTHYKLRYKRKEVIGIDLREGISKLKEIIDDEEAVWVEVER